MPITYPYTQYSGVWNLNSQVAAQAAGTWPVIGPRLYAWGRNTEGQLGQQNTTDLSSPKQVGSLVGWLSVTAGSYTLLAIKNDNSLWVSGSGGSGALGNGGTANISSLTQVGTLTNWSSVTSLSNSVLSIKTDGTLWGWGANGSGQLGLGNTTNYSSPKQIGALTNWSKVSSGSFSSFAIKTDGTLWAWGDNSYGQLGLGNTTLYSSPKQVGALTNWLSVSGGGYFTTAVKTDGTMWSWGLNNDGRTGRNLNSGNTLSPVQIGALTTWSKAFSSTNAGFAIKTDGTLWSWGNNGGGGQLGLNTQTSAYSSPKQVGSLTNWLKVAACFYTVGATKTDGTLWAWGWNSNGQSGQGNTTNYSSPKQVGSLTAWQDVAAGVQSMYGIANT